MAISSDRWSNPASVGEGACAPAGSFVIRVAGIGLLPVWSSPPIPADSLGSARLLGRRSLWTIEGGALRRSETSLVSKAICYIVFKARTPISYHSAFRVCMLFINNICFSSASEGSHSGWRKQECEQTEKHFQQKIGEFFGE